MPDYNDDDWGGFVPPPEDDPHSDDPLQPLHPDDIDLDFFNEALDFNSEKRLVDEIANSLGVGDVVDVFSEIEMGDNVSPNLRGVRFGSITEAILYLFDAGVLRFSGVALPSGDDDFGIGVVIETETDTWLKKMMKD